MTRSTASSSCCPPATTGFVLKLSQNGPFPLSLSCCCWELRQDSKVRNSPSQYALPRSLLLAAIFPLSTRNLQCPHPLTQTGFSRFSNRTTGPATDQNSLLIHGATSQGIFLVSGFGYSPRDQHCQTCRYSELGCVPVVLPGSETRIGKGGVSRTQVNRTRTH